MTGIDWSDAMLDIARARAADLGCTATLQRADAHQLPFDDASFDTVVCTFGLCAIPDHTQAISEMTRVLHAGGRLILVDHIEGSSAMARAVQRFLEIFTVPLVTHLMKTEELPMDNPCYPSKSETMCGWFHLNQLKPVTKPTIRNGSPRFFRIGPLGSHHRTPLRHTVKTSRR